MVETTEVDVTDSVKIKHCSEKGQFRGYTGSGKEVNHLGSVEVTRDHTYRKRKLDDGNSLLKCGHCNQKYFSKKLN